MAKQPFVPHVSKQPAVVDKSFIEHYSTTNVSYIISNSNSLITKNQIEACRHILNRVVSRKKIKYRITVRYNITRTKKSIGTRMGKGKGKIFDKVSLVKKYNSIFEFKKIPSVVLKTVLFKIKYKLPVRISCVVA